MLGPTKPRRLDQPFTVSLEDLVLWGHFYRHVEGFVRDWVHGHYADKGRPSIDPVVFFKLQLVMLFEGIRSERELIETVSLHLAHRWYLGYALDVALPDPSSLTRIRQRGLENVNSEGLLVAAGQNLKRFLAASGWGRRHAPCGSLVALPRDLQVLSTAFGCPSPRRRRSIDPPGRRHYRAPVKAVEGPFSTP
jgi:hypothetical protein